MQACEYKSQWIQTLFMSFLYYRIIGPWVRIGIREGSAIEEKVMMDSLCVTHCSIRVPPFVRPTLKANFENLACSQFPAAGG